MKKSEFLKLKKGDFINHKRYGLCYIDETLPELSAVAIRPLKHDGIEKLWFDSKTTINKTIENSPRRITEKVSNPNTKLIFLNEEVCAVKFEVHEWVEFGVIRSGRHFSTKCLQTFSYLQEAKDFANQ